MLEDIISQNKLLLDFGGVDVTVDIKDIFRFCCVAVRSEWV